MVISEAEEIDSCSFNPVYAIDRLAKSRASLEYWGGMPNEGTFEIRDYKIGLVKDFQKVVKESFRITKLKEWSVSLDRAQIGPNYNGNHGGELRTNGYTVSERRSIGVLPGESVDPQRQ